MADPHEGVREWVARILGIALAKRPDPPPSFGQHVCMPVQDDDEDVAIVAAEATGIGAPFNSVEIMRDILSMEDEDDVEELIDEVLDGVDASLDDDRANPHTLELLEVLLADGPDEHHGRARRLLGRATGQVREYAQDRGASP